MNNSANNHPQQIILELENDLFFGEEREPGEILLQRAYNLKDQIFSALKLTLEIMTDKELDESGRKVMEKQPVENLESTRNRHKEVKRLNDNGIENYTSWTPVIEAYCQHDLSRLDLNTICPDYKSRISNGENFHKMMISTILEENWTMTKTEPKCVVSYGYFLFTCLRIRLDQNLSSKSTHALLERLDWCANSFFFHLGAAIPNYGNLLDHDAKIIKKKGVIQKTVKTFGVTIDIRDEKILNFIADEAKKGTLANLKRQKITTLAKKISALTGIHNSKLPVEKQLYPDDHQAMQRILSQYYDFKTKENLPDDYVKIILNKNT